EGHGLGDAPGAGYVEPKPPDPSWITPHKTPCTHNSLVHSYVDYEDEWFYYNNILKKERLSYDIGQLGDEAFKWWVQEENDIRFYKEPPITTWRDLREIMRDKYEKKYTISQIKEMYPKRYPTHSSKKEELRSKTPVHKVQAKTENQTEEHKQCSKQKAKQRKSSELSKIASIICYRCHQKGHYAAACPSRSIETLHLATQEINAFKDNLAQLVPEMSISNVIHLSLPRNVDAGNTKGQKDIDVEENIEEQCPGADTFQTNVIIKSQPTPITALKLEVLPTLTLGILISDKYELVEYWNNILNSHTFKYSAFNDSSLILKEEPPAPKPTTREPDKNRGVILSYLFKGEPPDAQPTPKPIQYQGKVLDSQKRMKSNLLYFGADYIDIKSASPMEKQRNRKSVENMKLKKAKEANQDIVSIKAPYLTNQEEYFHETNFHGL
ncbi:hypothetical protein N665_0193s0014, partial [Sinapis alba]